MSLIPFILDLADELQEFQRCLVGGGDASGGSVGQQQSPHLQQQQQKLLHHHHSLRHHPYQHARLCCSLKEKEANGGGGDKLNATSSTVGQGSKSTAHPVVNKNGWMMVSMNVKQFAPNELKVKTIDNCIIVEGRHEDKEDIHGVISRHFIRKYALPKGYDPNEVLSTLSSDGILTVKAPPPAPLKTDDGGDNDDEEILERIVDIQQTEGPAHSSVKDSTAAAANAVEQAELPKMQTASTTPMETEVEAELETTPDERMEISSSLLEAAVESKVTLEKSQQSQDMQLPQQQCGDDNEVEAASINQGSNDAVAALDNGENSAAAMKALAESAKPESQVSIIAAEEAEKTADAAATLATISNAADAVVVDAVAGIAENESDVNADANANLAALSENSNEKNGAPVASDENDEDGTIAAAATLVVPTDVPAAMDLDVCVPKGVVIDAANADVDGDTLDNNASETNGGASCIEALPSTAAAEEVVAN